MTVEQRLNTVETDLETVKQLLVSAANYAESANRGLDRLTVRFDELAAAQTQTQSQIDQLRAAQTQTQLQIDELATAQTQTQLQIDELATAQTQTQLRIDQLTAAQATSLSLLNQLTERVEQFVFHSQRLITQQAGRLEVLEGQAERLEALVRMLYRNEEAQQSQMREFQVTTSATLERIDRVLDYLLRQSGG